VNQCGLPRTADGEGGEGSGIRRTSRNGKKIFSSDGWVVLRRNLRVNIREKRSIFCILGVSDVYVRYDPDVHERGGGNYDA